MASPMPCLLTAAGDAGSGLAVDIGLLQCGEAYNLHWGSIAPAVVLRWYASRWLHVHVRRRR